MLSANLRIWTLLAFMALSACKFASEAPDAQTEPTAAAETTALLAAAEPFEVLTESAFVATPGARDKLILDATNAVVSIHKMVPEHIKKRLQRYLVDIESAQKSDRKADLAIASIEAYRELVSSIPGKPVVPVNVSLLDYCGFRYHADALASPVRWEDMKKAMAFARMIWQQIAPGIHDAKLATRFQAALDNMDQAIQSRDVVRARASAIAELDIVDELETAFAKQ